MGGRPDTFLMIPTLKNSERHVLGISDILLFYHPGFILDTWHGPNLPEFLFYTKGQKTLLSDPLNLYEILITTPVQDSAKQEGALGPSQGPGQYLSSHHILLQFSYPLCQGNCIYLTAMCLASGFMVKILCTESFRLQALLIKAKFLEFTKFIFLP